MRYYVIYVKQANAVEAFRAEGFGHLVPLHVQGQMATGLCFVPGAERDWIPHHVSWRNFSGMHYTRLPEAVVNRLVAGADFLLIDEERRRWLDRLPDAVEDFADHERECPIGDACPLYHPKK